MFFFTASNELYSDAVICFMLHGCNMYDVINTVEGTIEPILIPNVSYEVPHTWILLEREDLGRLKLLKFVTAENNTLFRFIFLQDDCGELLTERTRAASKRE